MIKVGKWLALTGAVMLLASGFLPIVRVAAAGPEMVVSTLTATTDLKYGGSSIVFDSSGIAYMADQYNNRISKILPDGTVSVFAGTGDPGYADGPAGTAQFNRPMGIAIDAAGNLYVADTVNNYIRKITPSGDVSTLAGDGNAGYADGPGATAEFAYPIGIAVSASGVVYVADPNNARIRAISQTGEVTTFAGDGNWGHTDGPGATAQFSGPTGIAIDAAGTLFVMDRDTQQIRKILSDGTVSTLAGDGNFGYVDGSGATAEFDYATSIAIDTNGLIYVTDSNNQRIRTVTQDGTVSTLAGTGDPGNVDGPAGSAQFNGPNGIAVSSSGVLYVIDVQNLRIRKIAAQQNVDPTPTAPGQTTPSDTPLAPNTGVRPQSFWTSSLLLVVGTLMVSSLVGLIYFRKTCIRNI